jgi:hypothetical protein
MPNYNALAAQAAAQGQQAYAHGQAMQADDTNKANLYSNQYNQYQQQANAAQKGVSDYTNAMQGAYDPTKGVGNAQSAYDYNLGQQEANVKYDPNQMATATNNLNQANGALSAYSDFANTGASKWGMNAGGFAAANAGALSGLNNNIASNQGQVAQLMDKYKTAQTGANSVVGLQQKGQEDTLAGLQNIYTNAANQRDSAASQMQFYQQLASTQGGLNSQQLASYHSIVQGYATAQQAMAQAAYLASQTQGQNILNTANQNKLNQSIAQQQAAQRAAAQKAMMNNFKSQGMSQVATDNSSGHPVAVYSASF